MRRIVAFLLIMLVLGTVAFFITIWIYPTWLTQSGGCLALLIIILVTGLGLIASGIVSWAVSFLFEDKELKERLLFIVGSKYKDISKKLNEITKSEINKEKQSRKYISNIFIESTEIKEKLRYFSEPFIFFQKIIEHTDRSLRMDYTVNVLKQIGYPVDEPVYPAIKLMPGNLGSLKENIRKYQTYLDQKMSLTDIFIKENGAGIKPEFITKIPQESIHLYNYRVSNLQYFWRYKDMIEKGKGDLHLLKSKFVIIKSLAGHGKTNLICDFVENLLRKKGEKCLYMSARSLNHLSEQETIEQAITRTLFTEAGFQFQDILRLVNYDKRIHFLFILIDGINEHKNLQLFSVALEQFAQRCSTYKIKIILTCRSEYFEDRFGNLLHIDSCSVIDMDERQCINKIPDVHIEALLSRYFTEFKVNISVDNIDPAIIKILNEDKLLLRIFSEAYENEQPAEYLVNLYKLEIFQKYYAKKVEAIPGLDNCLNEIITIMITENQFSNIQIAALSDETKKIVENTVYENVIIKKDMFTNPDLAFGKSEVINFVYDEFRDFLIASKVIHGWDPSNQTSIDLMHSLAAPGSPVAEGLQRYLCLWSIKNKKDDLLNLLSSQEWFGPIFIDSVFDSPDSLLSDFIFLLIKQLFGKNSTNTLHILWRFLRRANTEHYQHLNIEFLFFCLNELNDVEYKRIIVDALTERYDYEAIHITHICQLIVQAFRENRVSDASKKNLTKLVAYLVGVEDHSYYRDRTSELGEHPTNETLYIIAQEIGTDLVMAVLSEVISSSKADIIKSQLGSLLRQMGEE